MYITCTFEQSVHGKKYIKIYDLPDFTFLGWHLCYLTVISCIQQCSLLSVHFTGNSFLSPAHKSLHLSTVEPPPDNCLIHLSTLLLQPEIHVETGLIGLNLKL